MENQQSISELLDSINSSILDIKNHELKNTRIPSTLEIMVRGINGSSAIDFLFSPEIDNFISSLIKKIESGDFSDILNNEDKIKDIFSKIFGDGAFEGPISQRVMNSIKQTMESVKFQTMKGYIGNLGKTLKQYTLVIKNLKNQKKYIQDSEELRKYKDAITAIKQVVKFIAKIYKNRKIINRKVFNGINNLIHENDVYDEMLEGWD